MKINPSFPDKVPGFYVNGFKLDALSWKQLKDVLRRIVTDNSTKEAFANEDDFTDTSHGLRIARHHAKHAQVMQDIFGSNRLGANPALREGYILRYLRIQMVAHHEHIQVLGNRVYNHFPLPHRNN